MAILNVTRRIRIEPVKVRIEAHACFTVGDSPRCAWKGCPETVVPTGRAWGA